MEDEDRYTRITLRIPKDLHGLLGEEAARTSKSLNAEIIGRLFQTFSHPADGTSSAVQNPDAAVSTKLHEEIERMRIDQLQAEARRLEHMLSSFDRDRRAAQHRVVRQHSEIARLEKELEEAGAAENTQAARSLEKKLNEEKKWLAEWVGEFEQVSEAHAAVKADLQELRSRF